MIKRRKKSHNSTDPKGRFRIVDLYPELLSGVQKPIPEMYLEKLANDWIEWSKLEDSLRATDFFLEINIHNGIVYRWLGMHPVLKEAHTIVMQRLASRRERGAINRKYDAGTIDRYQPLYDKEYKEIVEWRASLRDKNEESNGTIIVNLPPAPITTEVPERKKE